jgi:hypothetical protein
MSFRLVSVWAVLAATSLGSACNDDGQPCDPGQVIQDRLCIAGPKPDAEAPDVETVDGEIEDVVIEDVLSDAPAPPGMFGKPCMMAGDSAECAAPAPYCGIAPNQTVGYCTAINCKADPNICPAGWTCFDVGIITFCSKPP